jgi:holo-[acyl-carrier protein] synthase
LLIYGTGVDLIETDRVLKLISRGRTFLEGIFTDLEVDYCSSKRYPEQHFAARFAAKEAFLKALGTGWRDGIGFSDIEVRHDALGKPLINLTVKAEDVLRRHVTSEYFIHVSLSHIKEYATATVIIETRE